MVSSPRDRRNRRPDSTRVRCPRTGPRRHASSSCTDTQRAISPAARTRTADDRGLSTVEVVILAPVMILFILVLVAFGQMVEGRGAIDGAARDAARAGSLQWDVGNAMAEARKAAQADLGDVCTGPVTVTKTSAGFADADLFTVEVSCQVRGLAMVGLDIKTRMSGSFTAPLDPFKRKAG